MSEVGVSAAPLGLEEALRAVVESAPVAATERATLSEALGRALAGTVVALVDQPPFDKSAMDGFAHGSSLPAPEGPWRVVGIAAARAVGEGEAEAPALREGECIRIMTGAVIPPGARAVQRLEWTEALPSGPGPALVRFTQGESIDNIVRRGENQRAGERLLEPRVLGPQDIGLLASSGYGEILVAKRPRVAVFSTGDELASCGKSPLPSGAIYDTNGPQLAAQAVSCGCEASFLGIVRDDEAALANAFVAALSRHDILLVSGGVSMGDFDHVPRALVRAGIRKVFHGLAVRPGKPFFFGLGEGGKAAFGFPGNPVSTFIGFELLVRPHLSARLGLHYQPRLVRASLSSAMERRKMDRHEFRPARLEVGADGRQSVRPVTYKGSSMLSALAEADCLVAMEPGVRRLEEGRLVDARLVRA